jgi:phospholipase/carboxylesterase
MDYHSKKITTSGVSLTLAKKILIMLHGRGADSADIISVATYLDVKDTHIIAPQATNNQWYPYSFLAPRTQNEPWLSSSLMLLTDILGDIKTAGFSPNKVVILGFSQGACLALEFAAQNAQAFGGVIAFTGGLIGDRLDEASYVGNFKNTKVFIGNSDSDPHVPLSRSQDSKTIMTKLGADVTLKIYPRMAHTIIDDELNWVNENIFAG